MGFYVRNVIKAMDEKINTHVNPALIIYSILNFF
jgi:hypothetical protein